jgi:predicted small metal-binding protein
MSTSWPVRRHEEASVAKQITCACGYVFRADTDAELWEKAQEHIATAHPDMVGKVNREDILAQAELI